MCKRTSGETWKKKPAQGCGLETFHRRSPLVSTSSPKPLEPLSRELPNQVSIMKMTIYNTSGLANFKPRLHGDFQANLSCKPGLHVNLSLEINM